MISVAAIIEGNGPEIPQVNEFSLTCVRVDEPEFLCPGIAWADKIPGRHSGVLDQEVEAGRDTGGTSAAVRL
jgi:hypothetical protein